MSGSLGPPLAPLAPLPGPACQQHLLRPKGCTSGKQAASNRQRMPTEPFEIEVWVAGVEVEDEQAAVVAHADSNKAAEQLTCLPGVAHADKVTHPGPCPSCTISTRKQSTQLQQQQLRLQQ